MKSAQANLDRLRVLEKYKRIVAPFDGLVTARTTDVGALISAGSGGGPALFVVSDTSRLRAYVNVPQNVVPSIKIGTKAQIVGSGVSGPDVPATVEASSQSVDSRVRHDAHAARRRQCGRRTDDRRVRQCAARTARTRTATMSVPASALIFDQSGLRVATVGADDRVVLKPITISRDLGREVEIASGLTADDRVIDEPARRHRDRRSGARRRRARNGRRARENGAGEAARVGRVLIKHGIRSSSPKRIFRAAVGMSALGRVQTLCVPGLRCQNRV